MTDRLKGKARAMNKRQEILTVRVPEELRNRLDIQAAASGQTVSSLLRSLLDERLPAPNADHGPWWSGNTLDVREYPADRFAATLGFHGWCCKAGHATPTEAALHGSDLLARWAIARWEQPRAGTYGWERKQLTA